MIYPHLELCPLTDVRKSVRAAAVKAPHTLEAALILPEFLITEEFAARFRGQNAASSDVRQPG